MVISKREFLVRRMRNLGLMQLLAWAARRPGLLALAYHRIGPCSSQPFDDGVFSATAESFRDQIRYLRDHFEILPIDELLDSMHRGLDLKKPTALITFDDGYRDNFETALPILREFEVPAVFFIAPGYIDRPRLTWWDRIAYVVKNTKRDVLEIEYPTSAKFDLRENGRSRVAVQILSAYTQTPEIDQQCFFDLLEDAADVSVDSRELGDGLFMSWDQVRKLNAEGMEIGGHTYDHPVLSRVSEDDQLRELTLSKDRLESEVRANIRVMAYPVGGLDCFDDATKRLVSDTGYEAAFSFYGGFNRPGHHDPLDIRRISVERQDSLPMFRFRASMCNLFDTTVF